jgi:WD40 repeat protein
MQNDSPGNLSILKALGPDTWLVKDRCHQISILKQLPPEGQILASLGSHPQMPPLQIDQGGQGDRINGLDHSPAKTYLLREGWIEGSPHQGLVTEAKLWTLFTQLFSLLKWIHAHGVIHGSITPNHLIRCSSDQIVLVGWGVCLPVTQEGFLVCNKADPEYAAPEQLMGDPLPASDYYSLGLTGLHLLTLVSPFDLIDHWQEWVNSERGYSERLFRLFGQLLSRDPEQRYPQGVERPKKMDRSPSAFTQPQQTLSGSMGAVYAVAVSPSQGKTQLIASGGEDKKIWLWDPDLVGSLVGHSLPIRSLAFHPSEPLLVSGGDDGQILLWDLDQQILLKRLTHHTQAVKSVAFHPDGSYCASGSADKTVKLWHETKVITSLESHRLGVTAIAFSPNGYYLASASQDRMVCVWDLTQDPPVLQYRLTGHTWGVLCVAFSPDSSLLASGGDDNLIYLWDLKTGGSVCTFGHSWSVASIAFLADGSLVSGSWDHCLKVWRKSSAQAVSTLRGHCDSVCSVAVDRDRNLIISGSRDKTVKIWHP